ncbi:MAG TPA: hypothetical protein VGS28_03490 [Candidatus Saccharimonadales bacterium]|nr:hypothetical protein [Candidatus Saccharimonadales bacterium]
MTEQHEPVHMLGSPEEERGATIEALKRLFRDKADVVASTALNSEAGPESLSVITGSAEVDEDFAEVHDVRRGRHDSRWPVTVWMTSPLDRPTANDPIRYEVLIGGNGQRSDYLDNFSVTYRDYPLAGGSPRLLEPGAAEIDRRVRSLLSTTTWDADQSGAALRQEQSEAS